MSIALHRVVIATDFSARSLHAARWAVLHLDPDAEVVLAHVVATPDLPTFIRARYPQLASVRELAVVGATKRLTEFAATLQSSRVTTEVRVGDLAEQIADLACEVEADLIVVGRHGDRPGVTHRIGTTADRVVRISTVPVLLATSTRDVRPRHILAALDDTDINPSVVACSRHLAGRFDASLTGVHVVTAAALTHIALHACDERGTGNISPAAIRDDVARDGLAWVRNVMGGELPARPIDAEIAFGWPAHEIVAAAERRNCELIVIGRASTSSRRHPLLGTVTRQVLRNAMCPVLVVVEPATPRAAHAPHP